LDNLDIGIVVNNAGLLFPKPLEKQSEKDLLDLVNVNVYHTALLSKIFADRFATRRMG